MTHGISKRLPLLAAAGVAAFLLAGASASAQDYYGSADDDYGPPPPAAYDQGPGYDQYGPNEQYGSTEEVIVTAPRPRFEPRSEIGAPIENVSLSRDVRYDDLDLTTPEGARELRERIRFTAQQECRQLDTMYPIAADGSPPCYRTAVEDGMQQADEAIDRARNYADRE
jgi:UrcA family protein